MSPEPDEQLSRLERVYTPLGDHLHLVSPDEDVVLSFAEIEALIGCALPPQARSKEIWWASIPRQPQSRAWLRADRRAHVALATETVTFVWEVFVRNNSLERIQSIRTFWLRNARSCLADPPRGLDDMHVKRGWWEPHDVYLLHLAPLGKFKVGLTKVGSTRLSAVGGSTARVVDRMRLANRWAALVIEHHVLDLAWDAWEQPDRLTAGQKGETEQWDDWLVPPPLSAIRDSLDSDVQLPGWYLSIYRSES